MVIVVGIVIVNHTPNRIATAIGLRPSIAPVTNFGTDTVNYTATMIDPRTSHTMGYASGVKTMWTMEGAQTRHRYTARCDRAWLMPGQASFVRITKVQAKLKSSRSVTYETHVSALLRHAPSRNCIPDHHDRRTDMAGDETSLDLLQPATHLARICG